MDSEQTRRKLGANSDGTLTELW